MSYPSRPERLFANWVIPYEMIRPADLPVRESIRGTAVSVNVCSGGMLVVMDHRPEIDQVIKVSIPTRISTIAIDALAQVRWAEQIDFPPFAASYRVGLKFLFSPSI